MANFRDNKFSKGGGGGFRGGGSFRGPVTMHPAVCDNCRKDCEVPFRPTSGKPIFCSSCFESKGGSDSRRSEGRNFDRPSFEDSPRFAGEAGRPMFEAVCDECRNNCKVPFRPSGDKPIYCSNCFGSKKGAGIKENGQSQPQFEKQFKELNSKLDQILGLLTPVEKATKKAKKPEKAVSEQPTA